MNNIIENTFTTNKEHLPALSLLKQQILTDNDDLSIDHMTKTSIIREKYIKYSFSILSHDFILSIREMTYKLKINKIAELSCRIGWLTFWLRKYEVPIVESVDNKSWKGYEKRYLKHVRNYDSIEFIKQHNSIELFILSWPYMDEVAENIWKAMRKGQFLLFIGEGSGGCTATEEFFQLTNNCRLDDKWELDKNFISFWGIHDRPVLFQKE